MHSLPNRFAVIRTNSSNEPYMQLIQAERIDVGTYRLTNTETRLQKASLYELSTSPFSPEKVKIEINNSVRTFDYWVLPCSLINLPNTPILDFPSKYWLPRPTQKITIENPTKCMQHIQRFNEIFMSRSYSPRSVIRSRIESPPTSPISMRSDYTIESQAIEEPEETVVHISRPLALPAYVGDLLLEKAWKSDDSCPITAQPYKDIQHLSVTSCYHIFEKEAIHTWATERKLCPVCRTFMTNIVSKEKEN